MNNYIKFISEILLLNKIDKEKRLEKEKMKIASKEYAYNNNTLAEISKLLFIQMWNIPINELEFIRACASNNLEIKKIGYLGMVAFENPQKGLLLLNTLSKDLQNPDFFSKILTFIGNFNGRLKLDEIFSKMKPIDEESPHYLKYIIVKSKNKEKLWFSMFSAKNPVLYVKLQMLLQKNYFDDLTSNDILCLKEQCYFIKCKYTLIKLIQVYRILCSKEKIKIDEKLFEFLKKMILNLESKDNKFIDLALSIEVSKILIETNYFTEKAEYFIFQLINSLNVNFRYMGCDFAMKYGIFNNLLFEKITKSGINVFLNVRILLNLISKTNYKKVYKQREEIIHYMIKQNINLKIIEKIKKLILLKIAESADQEFLFKIIIENPDLYFYIRHKNILNIKNSRLLLGNIITSCNIYHFIVIYDIFPNNFYSNEYILELSNKHLEILLKKPNDPNIVFIIDGLIDILLYNGNKELNKKLLIDWYNHLLNQKLESILLERMKVGISLFNLISEQKLLN